MDNYDLVTIGHVGYDFPETKQGEKKILGGAAYFAAKAASLFSKKLGIVSRIGSDFDVRNLQELGIDLSGIKVINGGKTFRWYAKYDEEFNVISSRGELNVGENISPEDIPEKLLNTQFFHVASMPPQMQKKIVSYIKEKNCQATISIDTIEAFLLKWPEETNKVFSTADIVFVNEKEFQLLNSNIRQNKQIVKKMGSNGAEALFNGNKFTVPAPKVDKVFDTTGAGDTLAGVFLTLLAKGETTKKALKEAVKIASKSVTAFGIGHI